MTILEQRFLETVPSRLSDITKEIKELNASFKTLLSLFEEIKKQEEE